MIYLFCPLHAEALPLIQNLHLVKQDGPASFMCYGDGEKWFLTVCGTGKTACATAVGAVLATNKITGNDIVVLYGSAAGVMYVDIGKLYNGVKIVDMHSGQDGYPDVMTKDSPHPSMIVTGEGIYEGGWQFAFSAESVHLPLLYDTESSAFCKAAMYFCHVHQIAILRYVSDKGDVITKDVLKQYSMQCMDEAVSYMEHMHERIQTEEVNDYSAPAEWLNGLLMGSMTMQNQCRQMITWCELSGMDWKNVVEGLMEEGVLPVQSKEEGKKVLHELKKQLCG